MKRGGLRWHLVRRRLALWVSPVGLARTVSQGQGPRGRRGPEERHAAYGRRDEMASFTAPFGTVRPAARSTRKILPGWTPIRAANMAGRRG
jgi:hypothetical protein